MTRLDLTLAAACTLAAFGPRPLHAQDPFEIHVYEYEELKPGQATFETHLNYFGLGTHQTHLTGELTLATTEHTALGFMVLSGHRPGVNRGLEYAGWRVLPHFYVPESWGLPLKLGLVAEFSFQKDSYEENPLRVEIRPIVEKKFGAFQFVLNPVFERALRGPDVRTGWHFSPAARVAYDNESRFTPALEYYSSLGELPGLSPIREQFHQILPGGDLKLGKRLLWSFGVGAGLNSTGNRLVCKSRLELLLGKL